MLKSPSNWKLILASLVGCLIIYTIVLDFTDPLHPDWNLFQNEELLSTSSMYGAKAAILAMAAAATLFIGFIPIGSSSRGKTIDLVVGVVGAVAAISTGWFWLLSATDGKPAPYLLAIVPTMGVFLLVLIISIVLRLAEDLDKRGQEETDKRWLTWEGVILLLAVPLALALIIGAMVLIPRWFF